MKYYYIIDNKGDDEFTIGATDDIFEAQKIARDRWDSMTAYDQKHSTVEIRHYTHDIEDEDCTCFDYDIAPEAWYYWYAVLMDDEDNDHGCGSHDWHEAVEMAKRTGAKYIATVDYRDDFCIDVEPVQEILDNLAEH